MNLILIKQNSPAPKIPRSHENQIHWENDSEFAICIGLIEDLDKSTFVYVPFFELNARSAVHELALSSNFATLLAT